jgi:hypothetical protein
MPEMRNDYFYKILKVVAIGCLLYCLLWYPNTAWAQSPEKNTRNTISGYVEDAESGERLIGAALFLPDEQTGNTTNNYGFFSLQSEKTQQLVRVSYLGYLSLDTLVSMHQQSPLIIKLQPEKGVLDEIVITDTKLIQEETQMSKITLSGPQIMSLPKFFGEADLLKTLQLMPGVQQGSEGTSALLVRGGSPDQNLFLLDGAPLYNPSHMLGIFSTFNVSTIKNVDLYKGAFPSRFGGRISSVVDIATKDGNMQKVHGDFSIGMLASQLTLEGPIKKDKTTFLISARRTYGDLFIAPMAKIVSNNEISPTLYFYDFNLKLQHRFSENDRLFLSVYGGKDKFGATINDVDRTHTAISWGNYLGTLRWNHVFSNKLFSNLTLLATDFGLKIGAEYTSTYNGQKSEDKISLQSGIRDYGGKIDFDYFPHYRHKVKFGAGITHHRFRPGTSKYSAKENGVTVDSFESKSYNTNNNEIDVYLEDEWKVSDQLSANLGLHWSALQGNNTTYQQLQPRLSVRYLLPANIGLKLSYAKMAQYMHLLSGNTITLPTDLWVPATDKIKPQIADQFAAGLARSVFQNQLELSVEGYYKDMSNVIEYKDGASYVVASTGESWEDKITSGKSKSFGIELMAQKKQGRLTGWVAYTLSKTDRTFTDINFGRTFPYKYDRRHDFKTVATYRLTKGIEVSGCFIYQSATPFTLAFSQFEPAVEDPYNPGPAMEEIKNITARNNVRIEPYHRLDISINFIRERQKSTRTWNISVYNVYNRKNPFYYYHKNFNSANSIMKIALLPILPSISYSIKF